MAAILQRSIAGWDHTLRCNNLQITFRCQHSYQNAFARSICYPRASKPKSFGRVFLAWGKLSTNEGGSCAVRCTIVVRRGGTQSRFSGTTVSFCLLENPVLTSLLKKKLENDGFRESYSWRRNSCCSWLGFCFVWGELQQALLWSKTSL
jgi:hypothetical protein